jgi:hypothetical protein
MSHHETPYPCPECDGTGETECACCGSEAECLGCDGTGLDPDRIDLGAWGAAVARFRRQPGTTRWFAEGQWRGWVREAEVIGLFGPQVAVVDRLAYEDFLKPKKEP